VRVVTALQRQASKDSDAPRTEQAVVYTTTPETFDAGERRRLRSLSARADAASLCGIATSNACLDRRHWTWSSRLQLKPTILAAIPVVEGGPRKDQRWRGGAVGAALDGRVWRGTRSCGRGDSRVNA